MRQLTSEARGPVLVATEEDPAAGKQRRVHGEDLRVWNDVPWHGALRVSVLSAFEAMLRCGPAFVKGFSTTHSR